MAGWLKRARVLLRRGIARADKRGAVSERDRGKQIQGYHMLRLRRAEVRIHEDFSADPGRDHRVAPASENHAACGQLRAGNSFSSGDPPVDLYRDR